VLVFYIVVFPLETMAKIISQETFDSVVKENIDDFEMTEEEAISDAVKQFEAQVGVGGPSASFSFQIIKTYVVRFVLGCKLDEYNKKSTKNCISQ